MAIRERNKSKRREEGEGSPRGTGAGAGMARQLPGVDWGVWRAPQLYCLSHGALVMVDPPAPSTPPPSSTLAPGLEHDLVMSILATRV